MGLGKHIQKRLDELEWEQKDLVDKTRPNSNSDPVVDQQTLSAIITRDSKRTMYLEPIADALRLTANELISGKWNKPNSAEPKNSPLYKPSKTENIIFAIVKSLADEEQEELLEQMRAWYETHAVSQKHVRGTLRPIGNTRMLGAFGTPKRAAAKRRKAKSQPREGK